MFSTARFCRACCAGFLLLGVLVPARPGYAGAARSQAGEPETPLYRVFLRDSSTLLSYGEFARVADRIVISVPLGNTPAGPDLHLVSIPSDSVDWDKTDAYAETIRATRYAATRGPDDFAMLSGAVSNALTDIGLTTDPARKIAMAAEARRNVTRWVAEHFGYRAEDVARMATLFDEVVSETRAASGLPNFDLSLIANLAAPPSVALMAVPTDRDRLEHALRAAVLAPDATERISLLRGIERRLLDAGMTGAAGTVLRARVTGALAVEKRASRGYDALTRGALRAANRYARRADVTGVERAIRRALGEDDRLGQRRPQEMASLLATLDVRLDAARRLRLARDSWAARAAVWRRYHRALAEPLAIMRESRGALDEIRRLAGPSRARLGRLVAGMTRAAALLGVIAAPAEGAEAHSLLKNSIQLAARAAASRQRAIAGGDMPLAWEAAAAASGALMLFDRAAGDLGQLRAQPKASRQP